MTQLIWPLVAVACLLGACFLAVNHHKRLRAMKQAVGLQWLHSMRLLLANIQKHRGLSTGYLKGDHGLQDKIDVLQTTITQNFQEIESVDTWLSDNESWQSIREHWQRLQLRYTELEVENNLTQHGKIIRNTLYLIEEMAEAHCLLRISNIDLYGYDFIWKDLLQAVEYMGQARALGTGVAASGSCDSVERIRLNYLKEKINAATASLWKKMPYCPDSKRTVEFLLLSLDTDILQHRTTIAANDYFDLATQAIESLYGEYDKTVSSLKV